MPGCLISCARRWGGCVQLNLQASTLHKCCLEEMDAELCESFVVFPSQLFLANTFPALADELRQLFSTANTKTILTVASYQHPLYF